MEFNFVFIVFMLCVKQIAKKRHEKIGIAVKSISHKTQQKLFRLHQSAYCHIQVTISLFTEEMEVKTHILDKRKQKSKWKSSGATCRWVEEDRSKYKHNEIWKPFTLFCLVTSWDVAVASSDKQLSFSLYLFLNGMKTSQKKIFLIVIYFPRWFPFQAFATWWELAINLCFMLYFLWFVAIGLRISWYSEFYQIRHFYAMFIRNRKKIKCQGWVKSNERDPFQFYL